MIAATARSDREHGERNNYRSEHAIRLRSRGKDGAHNAGSGAVIATTRSASSNAPRDTYQAHNGCVTELQQLQHNVRQAEQRATRARERFRAWVTDWEFAEYSQRL